MKKVIFILLTFLLMHSSIFSQPYDVEWGPVYKKDGLNSTFDLIGIQEDHYYMLMHHRKKGNTLLKYDMKHKLVSNKQFDIDYKDRDILQVGIPKMKMIETKNGTFGYINILDKKKKEKVIYMSKFEKGTFSEIKEIYNHYYKKRIKIVSTTYDKADRENDMVVSLDRNRVSFSDVVTNRDDNKKEEISVAVFDADMNLLWEKVQDLKHKDRKLQIRQTVVTNDGIVYVLGKLFEKKKSKSLPGYDYKIFQVTESGMKEIPISIGKSVAPTDAGLYFPDGTDADFILAGFYSDDERKSGIKGIFYASGKAGSGVKNAKIHKFDNTFLEDIAKKRDIKKERGIRLDFDIKNFIQFKDNSIGFIAENYFITTHSTRNSNGTTSTYYQYHSNALIIPRFTMDGELIKVQKIPKTFKSSIRMNTSYTFALASNKVYLMFNDYKTRKERSGKLGAAKWRYTDLVVINENGEIEFNETLFNNKEIDLEFAPYLSDFSEGKLLIGSIKTFGYNKYAFGLIKL